MPYGVGGAIAEGLQSGFEMGRSVTQDAERKRQFEMEQAVRKENADRLWQQEKDRYGRMADMAQVQAQQDHLAALDKLANGYDDRGEPVDPRLNEMRAQAAARLAQMHQSIATGGRLSAPGGVQAPASSTQAAPLPDLPQPSPAPSGVAGGPQANPAPAPGGVGAIAEPAVQSPLPSTAAAPPAPGIAGGAPEAAAVASPTTSAVTPRQQFVTQADQGAQDLASRLNTGQARLADVAPKDFAMMVASATKHDPSDLSGLHQGIADFHAGMQTGNNGLVIQGLNGVFGPQINQGAGQPSPYGGNIVSKKIVGLDPAASASGTIHPDRVMPRLEVTTDQTGPDGTPLIYHAPLLGADGKVAAIPLADAFNHIGAQGALASTLSHPDAQALLAKGARDPDVQQYLEYYRAQAMPLSKTQVLENRIQAFMSKNKVDRATAEQAFRNSGEIPWQLSIPRGVGGGDVAAAEQLLQDHPDQYKTIGDALNAIRSTTHAYSKNQPGAGGVAGGAGVPGAANPGSGLSSTAINPITGSRVLPTPDKSGLILGYTPSALDRLAYDYIVRGQGAFQNMGRGDKADPVKKAVSNRADELMTAAGISAQDYVEGKDEYKSNARSLSLQVLRGDAIDASMAKIANDFGTIDATIKGGNANIAPFLAKPLNAIREGAGSPELTAYKLAVKQVATEYERLLTGGQLSTAQLHEGARKDAEGILNENMTVDQVNKLVPVMQREMNNAQKATHGEIATIRSKMRPGSSTSIGAPAAAPVPAGWSVTEH